MGVVVKVMVEEWMLGQEVVKNGRDAAEGVGAGSFACS